MTSKDRFLAACLRKPVDRPPVWIMRQAGRYLPEYRKIREKHSFTEVCRTPELVAEVAHQPMRRFPLDAAILFSDILVMAEALGVTVDYQDGGPKLYPRIDTEEQIRSLRPPEIESALGYVGLGLKAIRERIGPDLALLGFCGAPYTMAAYLLEGGGHKGFSGVKRLLLQRPDLAHHLLALLSDAAAGYLKFQIESGADAVQMFDTWAGDLTPELYRTFAFPYAQRVFRSLKSLNVPTIYFMNGVSGVLDTLPSLGSDVLGLDWRVRLSDARVRTGGNVALQGNLDPIELQAPPEHIRRRVREMAAETGGTGHILNLGHGITPESPIDGLSCFVDEVVRLGD